MGALNSLLFLQQNRRCQRNGQALNRRSTRVQHLSALLFSIAHAPKSIVFFATSLIAAKPLKPCDGGLFGVFYLLLLLQQSQSAARARWLP